MQIFIIKGLLKGMVKLDNKLHFVGNGFEDVAKIIMYNGESFKQIEVIDFNNEIKGFTPISIILLNDKCKILGVGSTQGKVNVEKLIYEYNCNNKNKYPNSSFDNCILREVNTVEKPSKIDTIYENLLNDDINDIKSEMDNKEFENNDNDVKEATDIDIKSNVDTIYLKENESIQAGVDFIKENMDDIPLQNNNFYFEIKENLQDFLSAYPRNEELENKVWGSKWVKITADYDYSVGVIFEDNEPSIIAYALPNEDYQDIDTGIKGFGEWLQMDGNRGYLIYYQDAKTGKMITE